METITIINPWSGMQTEKTVEELMQAMEVFASTEETEAVNLNFSGETDLDWLRAFEATHGLDRLSEIAFS